MTNKRETILITVATVLVLLAAGRIGLRKVQSLKEDRLTRLADVKRQIEERRINMLQAEQAATRLAAWQRRSLPANRDVAHGLYKQWLVERLAESQLSDVHVASTTTTSQTGSQQPIAFTVAGRATLEQLLKFLYAFYRADHLHKLRSFSFVPGQDSQQVDLRFAVEALSLDGADHVNTLSAATSKRLAHDDLADYVKTIAGRNMFARYAPPQPSGQGGPNPEQAQAAAAKKDLAGQVYVTGLLDDGTGLQVWLNVRTTGQLLRLRPGESFQVEDLSGTITSIHLNPREVIVATEGKKLRVALGGSLNEGTTLVDRGG